MITFTSYIKKQVERDDLCGDFARDYIRVTKHPEIYKLKPPQSETLYGFYRSLPYYADYSIQEVLVNLWYEWIRYKHIGLKFNDGPVGYVYFYKIPNSKVFKIGRTFNHPEQRKYAVQQESKTELEIYNWMKLSNYDLIESELKLAFKKNQVQREWFQFEYVTSKVCIEIDDALDIYSMTDNNYETLKMTANMADYKREFQ